MLKDSAVASVDFGYYWRKESDCEPGLWSYWLVRWHPDTGHLMAVRANACEDGSEHVNSFSRLATIPERALVDLVLADWPIAMHEADSLDWLRRRAKEAEETGTIDGRERVEATLNMTEANIRAAVKSPEAIVGDFRDLRDFDKFVIRRFVRDRFAAAGFLDADEELPETNLIVASGANTRALTIKATLWL